MTAFYNERDPYAADWLRNLIAAGHIAPGVVSEEDIRDLRPIDLEPYVQCHFFAGIGVWSHALRAAGWSDDRPVWTGSCPCQPFSAAGQRGGEADERHLWPHFHWLIDQCRPPVVLGEQVASKDGLGWLDLVQADLEASGYAVGASDLCAAGFGGAHLRQRLYFVGLGNSQEQRRQRGQDDGHEGRRECASGQAGAADSLADAASEQHDRSRDAGSRGRVEHPVGGATGRLADPDDTRLEGRGGAPERADQRAARPGGAVVGMVHTNGTSQYERPSGGEQSLRHIGHVGDEDVAVCHPRQARSLDDVDWLLCRNPAGEPSWRPVEPGSFPLAHGVAARMGRLRAYGNALDAETASQFVAGVMDAMPMMELLR